MASSWSQRQTVLSLTEATIPERQASRATSATLSRDSGNPSVVGSSHARAFTWTMTSGGKSPGAARALALLQASQAFFEEPLAPLADDLPSSVEAAGDFIVAQAPGSQQNHLRSDYLKIWQRIFAYPMLEYALLLSIKVNNKRALAWHRLPWRDFPKGDDTAARIYRL
jgi:hypothetical protein